VKTETGEHIMFTYTVKTQCTSTESLGSFISQACEILSRNGIENFITWPDQNAFGDLEIKIMGQDSEAIIDPSLGTVTFVSI
jgi:hypothetical protein